MVSEPDVPTLQSMANIQQTSVTLTWDLGGTAVMNSTIVHYVDILSTPSWKTTVTIGNLSDLSPGHTYSFYLEVKSFDKTVRSVNHSVTTGEFVNTFVLVL